MIYYDMVQKEFDTSFSSSFPVADSEEMQRNQAIEKAIQTYDGPVWAKIFDHITWDDYTTPITKLSSLIKNSEAPIRYALRQSSAEWHSTIEQAIRAAIQDGTFNPFATGDTDGEFRCGQCVDGMCSLCFELRQEANFGW